MTNTCANAPGTDRTRSNMSLLVPDRHKGAYSTRRNTPWPTHTRSADDKHAQTTTTPNDDTTGKSNTTVLTLRTRAWSRSTMSRPSSWLCCFAMVVARRMVSLSGWAPSRLISPRNRSSCGCSPPPPPPLLSNTGGGGGGGGGGAGGAWPCMAGGCLCVGFVVHVMTTMRLWSVEFVLGFESTTDSSDGATAIVPAACSHAGSTHRGNGALLRFGGWTDRSIGLKLEGLFAAGRRAASRCTRRAKPTKPSAANGQGSLLKPKTPIHLLSNPQIKNKRERCSLIQ